MFSKVNESLQDGTKINSAKVDVKCYIIEKKWAMLFEISLWMGFQRNFAPFKKRTSLMKVPEFLSFKLWLASVS